MLWSRRRVLPFWVFYLAYFYISRVHGARAKPKVKAKTPQMVKLLGNFAAYVEMGEFLMDAKPKLENITCTTYIWDTEMSTVIDYIPQNPAATMKRRPSSLYMVKYPGGNITDMVSTALKEGYKQQCGAYIILLNKSISVTELLHFGDDLRMINMRARFLIWYGDEDKAFETDEIWKKLPNVVFFHAKLRRQSTKHRRLTLSIISFKWPIVSASTDNKRPVDFWRAGKLTKNEVWYRDRTKDLKNVTIRISVVEHPPSVIRYSSPDGYVEYAGTEIELIKELSQIMNFDFELVDADPVTKWGGQILVNSTRHFYGAIAKLIYGETDMGIGSFLILKENLDYLDMSIPLDVACTSFITPNPLPRPRYLALILPFRYSLWLLVLSICFIFAPIFMSALARLPFHATEYWMFSRKWQNTVLTSLSIMTQVALHIWPKFWTIRIFICSYWLFCLLITLAYRGAMVSFLSIPLYERPIDNLDNLAASGLRLGGWGSELYKLFTQQISVDEEPTKKELSRKYELITDLDDGISMVAEGKFALYGNIRYLKFIRQTRNLTKGGTPSMRLMKQCIVPVHIGIAYQKNSPIAPIINRHIRRFQESGLRKRWSQRLIARTKQYYKEQFLLIQAEQANNNDHDDDEANKDNDDTEAENAEASSSSRTQRILSLSDLQGPVYLILFGTGLSIGSFVGEMLLRRSKEMAKNMKDELNNMISDKILLKKRPDKLDLLLVRRFNIKQNHKPKAVRFKAKLAKWIKKKGDKVQLFYPYLE